MKRTSSLIVVAFLAASVCQVVSGSVASASIRADASGRGVTASSIKLGITYPDIAALKGLININPGNYQVAYQTLIDQINAAGGINGRKITAVFAPVNPVGTAGAQTACTQLTEDDTVFATVGFFQAADTACYLNNHDTPIIGASLTTAEAAQAKAPWYNNFISENDQVSKEMSYFQQHGVFAGKKVGVVSEIEDVAETPIVLAELRKLKVDIVQTAVNSSPSTDNAALTQQYAIIAQKFKAAGVTEVVAVGNSGNDWPRAEQENQGNYQPRIVAVDYVDLDAYVTNSAGHSNTVLKDAIAAGGIAPASATWQNSAMKRCIATIQAKEPDAPINSPVTATSTTPITWTAPEVACTQTAMFEDFAKAAGRVLNNQTFEKGAQSLTHVSLPGGGTFNFSKGHNDGDGPVYVYTWSPSANNLVLKTTIS